MESPNNMPTQGAVPKKSNMGLILGVGALLVIVVGVGSAWLISTKLMSKSAATAKVPGSVVTSTSAGMLDPSIKYDMATGMMVDGGISGEGTQHLDRDGIPAHFVYMTSSVVDLSSFVGKKVQVWGQTEASKKAGWLMDVSKVQVVQ